MYVLQVSDVQVKGDKVHCCQSGVGALVVRALQG